MHHSCNFLKKILFIFRDRGRGENKGEKQKHWLVAHTPNRGAGRQTRHVTWPGIQPVTFQFSGVLQTHWATQVRAVVAVTSAVGGVTAKLKHLFFLLHDFMDRRFVLTIDLSNFSIRFFSFLVINHNTIPLQRPHLQIWSHFALLGARTSTYELSP